MQQTRFERSERDLAQRLRAHAVQHGKDYSAAASADLTRILFTSLADTKYLEYFFPQAALHELRQKPEHIWRLSDAQGAVEGSEYTESARGKRCGHIFKSEEATYSCRTCQADPTCVLCTKCFHASDHDGHQVYVQMSAGTTGCCDCGDDEAWTRPIQCSIHTKTPTNTGMSSTTQSTTKVPAELEQSIQRTISTVMDFLLDVFSCCPEDMRSPKQEDAIRHDEEKSRLMTDFYGPDLPDDTFALLLWNDEKHSVDEVAEQVAKACKKTRTYGREKAGEIDQIGRSLINKSTDLETLLKQARILAQIKVTVTIRSTRDIFREEMCHTIVKWLADIAGCSVAGDNEILMHTVCQELLRPWRQGSPAFNMQIARNGIVDHQRTDARLENMRRRLLEGQAAARFARMQVQLAAAAAQQRPAGELVAIVQPTGADANLAQTDNEQDANVVDEDQMDIDDEAEIEMMEGEFVMAGDDELIDVFTAANEGPRRPSLHESEDEEMNTGPTPPPAPTRPPGHDGILRRPEGILVFAAPEGLESSSSPNQLITGIPQTPRKVPPPKAGTVPSYWLELPAQSQPNQSYALHERMDQRVRLDSLILYDLRLWKTLRFSLSHLYISTVVTVPSFKRTLGLRFATLYTPLAQLYLVADREPEHSIIHLSLQMLTTPTITAEIVQRSNFPTRLIAILYTFLTKRQVGNPEDVDVSVPMSFEAGVMSNRRIFHFFQDMRYLLDSPYVQDRICHEPRYLLQFLDFARLSQGICANTRAVGEHVEYESETWYAAGNIVRDITRLSRQFCESFRWHQSEDASNICRALRQTAKISIINSLGVEYEKFPNAEHKGRMKFKTIPTYGIEWPGKHNLIPDFKVESSTMSFHHALHYTLSWLINSGKSMSSEQLKNLLAFSPAQLEEAVSTSGSDNLTPHEYMMALFDIPLRVCAWMAQMRAGMWVRNGLSLRHQMHFYRGITHRDVSHRRDLYLLQVAAVVCDPTTFLASVVDRFSMDDWVKGEYAVKQGFDDWGKMVDMADEMLHLLIVLLTDRLLLRSPEQDPNPGANLAMQELIQTLCFKPLTFSDLSSRLSDKVTESEHFQAQLDYLATYKAPEGLSDSGTFRLREEFIALVDPYSIYFSKGQREDCEKIWREHAAKTTNTPVDQLVYKPSLQNIDSGIFKDLASFTKTPLFIRIAVSLLEFLMSHEPTGGEVDRSRLEGLLNTTLHLLLIAVLDDKEAATPAFTDLSLSYSFEVNNSGKHITLIRQLLTFIESTGNHFQASRYRVLAVIKEMEHLRPQQVGEMTSQISPDWLATYFGRNEKSEDDAALKKKQAQDRQAKVMAAFKQQQNDFLQNQTIDWGVDEEDIEDDDDDDMMAGVDGVKTWPWPEGTCIFCQENVKGHELYGTLGYVAESNIFRITDLENPEYIHEVLAVPRSLDRSADTIRPFGVAGQNLEYVTKVSKDGDTVAEERRGLGSGFPTTQHQSGPVATGCGHVMHFSCFQTYEASTIRRHSYQITRNHPENITRSEFICPICKALGNTFLPVIWKPKACVAPPERDDDSFLIFLRDIPPIAVAEYIQQHRGKLAEYAERSFVSSLSSDFAQSPTSKRRQSDDDSQATSSIFGRWRLAPLDSVPSSSTATSSAAQTTDARPLNKQSLLKAYQRLLRTISANNLLPFNISDTSHSELLGMETMTKSLGYSIASVEIAQRGMDGSNNYIQSIPESVLTNLRIWSETVSSYFMLASLSTADSRGALFGNDILRRQAHSLFSPPTEVRGSLPYNSLFCQDIFVFLAECSICIVPILELEFGDVLRLCYFAEIVKVVLAILSKSNKAHIDSLFAATEEGRTTQSNYATIESFSAFVQHIISVSAPFVDYPEWIHNPNERSKFDIVIRSMLSSYILQFLRQSALLVHVRYGVDFSTEDSDMSSEELSELDHLTSQLGLPSIDEMVHITLSSTLTGHLLQRDMDYWINAYGSDSRKPNTDPRRWKPYDSTATHHQTPSFLLTPPTLALSHPTIYELISLPQTHDTLNAIAMTRRCPTTGGPLDDPSVCLFCGTFVCTQSRCCHRFNSAKRQEEGGCFVHREQCGGNVGLFLNVRKCAVLMLHQGNGSWFAAPYLDRYGETDVGLRRKEQLFLNRKRYERLYREVWLRQGLPTTVARKLESEVNSGGWEVM